MTERRISIVVDGDGRLAVAAIDSATGAVTRLDGATAALRSETEGQTAVAQKNAAATKAMGQAQQDAGRDASALDRAAAELRAELQQLLQEQQRNAAFMRRDLSAALGTLIDRADRTATGIEALGRRSVGARRDVGLLATTFDQLKGVLAGYAGLQGVQMLGRMVDGYSDVIGRLDDATSGEAALARARADTLRISRDYYADLEATASLYARTTAAAADLRISQAAVAEVVSTVNAGLLVGRAGTQEAASAILQLSQALGAGRLSGEEFNAVAEASPQLMRLFAAELHVNRGALKDLASEGKITSQVMVAALTGMGADALRERAEAVPLTISRAWQLAKVNATEYFGQADQSLGASSAIAQSLRVTSEHLDLLVATGVAITGLYGGRMVAAVLRSAAAHTLHGATVVRDTVAQNAQQVALLRSQGLTAAAAVRTVALANAQTVATATSTRFGAALAFVGGPIGVAIAGLAALGVAFVAAGDEGEQSAAMVANAWRQAKRTLDEFNAAPTAAGVDTLIDAGVTQQIESAREHLRTLREDAAAVGEAYARSIARFGVAGNDLVASLAAANAAVTEQQRRVDALDEAYRKAVSGAADMLQQVAGVTNSAPEARAEVEALADRWVKSGESAETMRGELARGIETIYGADAAARVAAASFRELSSAMAGGDYVKNMEQALRREQVRLTRVTQGNRAASRQELGLAIIDEQKRTGRDLSSAELAGMYRAWREVADATDAADAAQKRMRETTRGAAREARQDAAERKRAAEEAVRAMERLRELVSGQRATLGTAVDQANEDNASALRKLQELERESAATGQLAERTALLADARALQAQAHERALRVAQLEDAERLKQQDVVARTLDDLREEASAVAMTAKEREIHRLVMEAEAKARELANQQQRQSAELSAQEIAALKRQAEAYIDSRDAGERLRQIREQMAEQIDQLKVEAKAHDGLNASARAELAIRKALLGLSKEAVAARKAEIDALRAQARELDTLEQQRAMRDSVSGIFGNALDAIQQGRSPWDAFRTEGMRALTQIGKEFVKLRQSTGSWQGALKKTGETLKQMMPELAQLAGTAAGGGGQGAAIGAAIGGAIGSYFGPIGTVIGSLVGGWAGGTFDKGPEITVGRGIYKPEQTRSSRLVPYFQVRTESMTDPTSAAVADAIVEFDHFIYDMLSANERTAVSAALANWSSSRPVLTDVMKARMLTVLNALPDLIGDFVLQSSTDLQRQMQNLAEVLQLQELERDGDLLSGTLSRAIDMIKEFGRAGETAGQTYQRLAGFATQYGTLMGDVQQRIVMSGLNDYQRQQVQIEQEYRAQVRQANELARAMGLSGARSEDLARIEQLRAIRMAEVQRQLEAEQQRMLSDLNLSALSPLRDDQKLRESMQQLRAAVAGGDMRRAEEMAQTALGFGRNLYSSGRDYNALYAEVTGLLRLVTSTQVQGLGETQLDDIADLLTDLPENIARALFDALYALIPPQNRGNNTSGQGGGTGQSGQSGQTGTTPPAPPPTITRVQGDEIIARLRAIETATITSARAGSQVAEIERRREIVAIGETR